jgi:hypothetical protein
VAVAAGEALPAQRRPDQPLPVGLRRPRHRGRGGRPPSLISGTQSLARSEAGSHSLQAAGRDEEGDGRLGFRKPEGAGRWWWWWWTGGALSCERGRE